MLALCRLTFSCGSSGRESRFNPQAVNPKGAEGIAQFMPGTAAERGLENPFDPMTAIAESASYLADLAAEFGNVGLTAAAYNAGPERVRDWLAGQSSLPWETVLQFITGRPVEDWKGADTVLPKLLEATGRWPDMPKKLSRLGSKKPYCRSAGTASAALGHQA